MYCDEDVVEPSVVEWREATRKFANLPLAVFRRPVFYYDLDCMLLGCRGEHNFTPILAQLEAFEEKKHERMSCFMTGPHGAHILTTYALPGTEFDYERTDTPFKLPTGMIMEDLEFINLFSGKVVTRSTFPTDALFSILEMLEVHDVILAGKLFTFESIIRAAKGVDNPADFYRALGVEGFNTAIFY